jgi:hypothetical protein
MPSRPSLHFFGRDQLHRAGIDLVRSSLRFTKQYPLEFRLRQLARHRTVKVSAAAVRRAHSSESHSSTWPVTYSPPSPMCDSAQPGSGPIGIKAHRIKLIGDRDPTTRHLLQDILTDEEEHAQELKEWVIN